MSTIDVGVVGIGFGQAAHVPAFRMHPGCRVRAICATSLGRAQDVAERLEIPRAYGDWREMVSDPRIDAVSIATPPAIQTEVALRAIEAGKAVFAEKPLAATAEQAASMNAAARERGVAHMVDFGFPELPAWKLARQLLHQDKLGRLRHLGVSWQVETYASRKRLPSWKNVAATGGGVLSSFVSHVFHNLEWLTGERVAAMSAHLAEGRIGVPDAETYVSLSIQMASGLPVSAVVSCHACHGGGHRWEIYGDDGAMVLENRRESYMTGFEAYLGTRDMSSLERQAVPEEAHPPGVKGRVVAVSALLGRFLAWIADGQPRTPSFEQGVRTQHLLDAARQSHRSGRWCRNLSSTET